MFRQVPTKRLYNPLKMFHYVVYHVAIVAILLNMYIKTTILILLQKSFWQYYYIRVSIQYRSIENIIGNVYGDILEICNYIQ